MLVIVVKFSKTRSKNRKLAFLYMNAYVEHMVFSLQHLLLYFNHEPHPASKARGVFRFV